MNWIIQNLFYEPLGIEYMYPVVSTIYSGIEESINIIHNIFNTTEKLSVKENFYIDLAGKNDLKSLNNLFFIDCNYWDLYRRPPSYNKLMSDHFNWGKYNDVPFFNLQTSVYWFNLYPINDFNCFWMPKDFTSYKISFNFLSQYYDLNYLDSKYLKHHDYQSDTFYAFNSFWEPYRHNKTNVKGFYLFWYEHYGSVEIGIKAWFNWYYNSTYPALEENVFSSGFPISTSNLNYDLKHFFADNLDMYINPNWFGSESTLN